MDAETVSLVVRLQNQAERKSPLDADKKLLAEAAATIERLETELSYVKDAADDLRKRDCRL